LVKYKVFNIIICCTANIYGVHVLHKKKFAFCGNVNLKIGLYITRQVSPSSSFSRGELLNSDLVQIFFSIKPNPSNE